MNEIPLPLSYSVESDASLLFAWRFRADVANWNDPPAEFFLDGPFQTGSRGRTLLPGQEPLHWRLLDVRPPESFVVEMQLDRAVLAFEWQFEELPQQRTRLTQRVVLTGDNAAAYAAHVEAVFGANLADGMKRIAAEMAAAERNADAV